MQNKIRSDSRVLPGDISTSDAIAPIPLFREAAVAEQKQKYYGRILLVHPISFSYLTAIFGLIATSIILLFFVVGFTRKETVSGVLLPEQGLARVYASQAGILQERMVH